MLSYEAEELLTEGHCLPFHSSLSSFGLRRSAKIHCHFIGIHGPEEEECHIIQIHKGCCGVWGELIPPRIIFILPWGPRSETLVDPSLNNRKNLPGMHENNKNKNNIYIFQEYMLPVG